MNQELIRAIQARRRQLADQIEAEQKRGDHNRALGMRDEAWRLWQMLQQLRCP